MKQIVLVIALLLTSVCAYANDNASDFEAFANVGVLSYTPESVMSADVTHAGYVVPYVGVGVRACLGDYCPELSVKNSFSFNGSASPLDINSKGVSYTNAYLKIPTAIPLNFFSYPTEILLDVEYDSLTTEFSLTDGSYVDGVLRASGTVFSGNYSTITARLYVDTPVVPESSLFEHSYFGAFYSYTSRPAAVSGGEAPYTRKLIVGTEIHSGGLFYDIKKNMIADGFNLGVLIQLGYGDISVTDTFTIPDVKFGNLYGLVSYKAVLEGSYIYKLDNGIGLGVKAGINYNGSVNLLGTEDIKLYSVNSAGYFKYYATLVFTFAN